jgi:hypothetical protein
VINLAMGLLLLVFLVNSVFWVPTFWLLLVVFAVAWATGKERIDGLN